LAQNTRYKIGERGAKIAVYLEEKKKTQVGCKINTNFEEIPVTI
jgi:hypothetical protein